MPRADHSLEHGARTLGAKTLLVFVVALLPRLYVAIAWTREPVWDGHYYDIGAKSIAAGLGYVGTSGGAWCHYPVGYSALLGLAYAIAGNGQYVGPVLNALVGAALAALTFRLARYATSERRALIAGLVVALHPGLVAYAALLMTEPVAALAIVASALVAARFGHTLRGIAVAAVLLGLGMLVRPQSLLCAPALALFVPERSVRDLWRPAAVATLAATLTVVPWSLRNCAVMDGCAFVSTNAGWNLAIGSFPRATGRFATLHGSDGCRVVTGQVEQDRCWLDLGLGWIADDPRRWLALVPKKLGYTFDHESFPVGYLGEADPDHWPADRQRVGRGLLSWSHRLLLSLATVGVLAPASRKRPITLLPLLLVALWVWIAAMSVEHPFWPLAVLIVIVAALRWRALRSRPAVLFAAWTVASLVVTHAVFFGEDRYHMVVSPLLALLAASAFGRAAPAARSAA